MDKNYISVDDMLNTMAGLRYDNDRLNRRVFKLEKQVDTQNFALACIGIYGVYKLYKYLTKTPKKKETTVKEE